jgi:hypothetical protein
MNKRDHAIYSRTFPSLCQICTAPRTLIVLSLHFVHFPHFSRSFPLFPAKIPKKHVFAHSCMTCIQNDLVHPKSHFFAIFPRFPALPPVIPNFSPVFPSKFFLFLIFLFTFQFFHVNSRSFPFFTDYQFLSFFPEICSHNVFTVRLTLAPEALPQVQPFTRRSLPLLRITSSHHPYIVYYIL